MKPTKEEILEKFANSEFTKHIIESRNFTYNEVLKAMDEYAKIDWGKLKEKFIKKTSNWITYGKTEKIFNWFKNEIEKK